MVALYYYRAENGNFGDDLNPWLWPQLLPDLDGEAYHGAEYADANERHDAVLVGIGTLLDSRLPKRPQKLICGAGAGYGEPPQIDDGWTICWARGPLTAKLLGIGDADWVTDAAMLISRLPLPDMAPGGSLGFMPHHETDQPGLWDSVCRDVGLRYISPHQSVEAVLSAIRGLDVLYTEAMHGAIVADALRVPWVAVRSHEGINLFKWRDWCASLGVDYRPHALPALWPLGDAPSLGQRVRLGVKKRLAARALNSMMANGVPTLSDDDRLEAALDRMCGLVDSLRHRAPL